MNIAFQSAMTVPEYLAWAEAQTDQPRTELINGRVVTMSAEQMEHSRIKYRATKALERALAAAGIDGEALPDGPTVPIDAHTAYQPDASLRCGSALPGGVLTMTDPVVVVEVLSPSSAHTDTSAKLIGYFKLASLRHYLVIDPGARTVIHHRRDEEGAVSARILAEGVLRLDPPGLAIDIAELFG